MAVFLKEIFKPMIPAHLWRHKIEETLKRVIYHQQQKLKIKEWRLQIHSDSPGWVAQLARVQS